MRNNSGARTNCGLCARFVLVSLGRSHVSSGRLWRCRRAARHKEASLSFAQVDSARRRRNRTESPAVCLGPEVAGWRRANARQPAVAQQTRGRAARAEIEFGGGVELRRLSASKNPFSRAISRAEHLMTQQASSARPAARGSKLKLEAKQPARLPACAQIP